MNTNDDVLSPGIHAIVHTSYGHPVAADTVVFFCWSNCSDSSDKDNQSHFVFRNLNILQDCTHCVVVAPSCHSVR